jgi:hypothetical protein
MKWIIGIISAFVITYTNAQLVVENSTFNVLYRGYENIVQLGSDIGDTSLTVVCGPGLTTIPMGKGKFKVLVSGSSSMSTITVANKKNTLFTQAYKIKSLPTPELIWGSTNSGQSVSDRSTDKIAVLYPDNVPLNASFTIVSYTVSAKGVSKTFSGTGSRLTRAILESLEQLPDGTSVTITAKYAAKDKVQRSIAGTFVL